MRISEDRYFRDLRPLLLAAWMLKLEARTRTICSWTGLSRDRIRKLVDNTLPSNGQEAHVRHRGRSPRQIAYFFRSPRLYAHANVLASYFAMMDLVPRSPDVIPAKAFPSVPRGERLCEVYELYEAAYAKVPIDFERSILLATALAQRNEVDLARCRNCGGLMLLDQLAQDSAAVRVCQACKFPEANTPFSLSRDNTGSQEPEQMHLFDGTNGTAGPTLNGSDVNSSPSFAAGMNSASSVAAVTEDEDTIAIRDMPGSEDGSQ
jgi:hypothetical protein